MMMMSYVLVKLVTLLTVFHLSLSTKWNCADFYWRDFFGEIPSDAISAGKDQKGEDRFIGLVYIRGFELLPGTILPKQKIIETTAYSHIFATAQHVKILCSPHPEAFEWINTHSEHLADYTSRNLIPGGSEVGESLYIGRIFRNNSPIIGKVFKHERPNKGIWFVEDNKKIKNALTYDLLSYNCDNVSSFDIRLLTDEDKTKVGTC